MDESKHAAKVDWLVGWLVVAVVVDDMTSKYNLSNIQVVHFINTLYDPNV